MELGHLGKMMKEAQSSQVKGHEGKWNHEVNAAAAAAAKSLQSCPTVCNPMDCSLPDFSVHDSPGKNTGVGKLMQWQLNLTQLHQKDMAAPLHLTFFDCGKSPRGVLGTTCLDGLTSPSARF